MKAIQVEGLSKAYQLGDFGTGTISQDLERYWAKMRGKEDPFIKIGEVNDRNVKSENNVVWSLKDLNFSVEQGDALGIIGRNGAGKSTLLKILSRITGPTYGSVKLKGRVASLLEVGTGFHPELTGRENIFLNGAILGMRKKEIIGKFDEIVNFSGVERYVDTPVKRYSSGMYVRLAFAVAAHLESEILIVDEVLAVGDAEFQKKCLGKMNDISKGEGRTILFVSHNMGAISALCNKGLMLLHGELTQEGDINFVIDSYNRLSNSNAEIVKIDRNVLKWIKLKYVETNFSLSPYDNISLEFELDVLKSYLNCSVDFAIHNELEDMIIHSKSAHIQKKFNLIEGSKVKFNYLVKNSNLVPGNYYLTVYFHIDNTPVLWIKKIKAFTIIPKGREGMVNYLEGLRSKIIPAFEINYNEYR